MLRVTGTGAVRLAVNCWARIGPVSSATPQQRLDVSIDGLNDSQGDLGPAVVQDAIHVLQ